MLLTALKPALVLNTLLIIALDELGVVTYTLLFLFMPLPGLITGVTGQAGWKQKLLLSIKNLTLCG